MRGILWRRRRRDPFGRFAIISFLLIAVFGYALAWLSNQGIVATTLSAAREDARQIIEHAAPFSSQPLDDFDRFITKWVASDQRYITFVLGVGLTFLYLAIVGLVHSSAREIDQGDLDRAEQVRTQLNAIVEATTDFVATSDVDGRALYINRAGRRMLEIDPEEDTSGLSLLDHYAGWASDLLRNEAIPTAVTDGVWSGEAALLSRDGREIAVSQVLLAHRTPSGSVDFLSGIARDISERKRFETQLMQLASHDVLTELYNRRRFEEELARELAKAQRYGTYGAVLFLDLDGFKGVNDSLGHQAGDALLSSVAALLRSRLRETDILARLGGDEFAIVLPQTDTDQAQATASRLLEAVRSHTIQVGSNAVGITVSLGIALYPDQGTTAEELLLHADFAMYEAKQHRDDAYVYAPERDIQAQFSTHRTWEQRLRDALAQDRFILYAQPILDLHGPASQYELLLRLQGDNGEVIPPSAFLPVAERSGLIRAIDRWSVSQAIHLIAEQSRAGRDLCLEVNLSAKAFTDSELLQLIERELEATGINPSLLVLEITETAAIADINEARRFIITFSGQQSAFS